MKEIIKEIAQVYEKIDVAELKKAENLIFSHFNMQIVGVGAGRMGYSLQAFIMRLSHLGFNSYMLGDTTTPRIGEGDLVIVNSSSGETKSIVKYSEIAKSHGASIFVLTGGNNSSLERIADFTLRYDPIESKQLMKTVYEQFTFLLFDKIAESLAVKVPLTREEIYENHSILE